MVIAWMFFASTGILFARFQLNSIRLYCLIFKIFKYFHRYYKYLLPNTKLCGVKFWFVVHRPAMICVPIISIISFLIILSDENWTWIPLDEPAVFAHSIFGIVAIGFSFFQVFSKYFICRIIFFIIKISKVLIAFLRCGPEHPKRFIFNHFHRTVGLTAFLCASINLTIYSN